ncbi:MAG: hypothetical protein WBQ18_15480, partial [Solirubrobacteraceae bacterium]
ERDRTVEAQTAARRALAERTGALESARDALAEERAEAGRLRNRLSRIQETRPTAAASKAAPAQAQEPAPARPRRAETSNDTGPARREDAAQATRSFSAAEAASLLGPESPEPPRPTRAAPAAAPEAWAELASVRHGSQGPDPADFRQPAAVHSERPLNPSLRSRSAWAARALAVLVLAIVVVAVILVIQSAGSH